MAELSVVETLIPEAVGSIIRGGLGMGCCTETAVVAFAGVTATLAELVLVADVVLVVVFPWLVEFAAVPAGCVP
jgi:hypothetical protein